MVFLAHMYQYRFFRATALSVGVKMACSFHICANLSAFVDTALPFPALGSMAAVKMEAGGDGGVERVDEWRGVLCLAPEKEDDGGFSDWKSER